MRLPPRPLRRLFLPIDAAVLLIMIVGLSLVAVVGTLVIPLSPRRRVLRLAAFSLHYCVIELAVMVGAATVWVRRLAPGPLGTRAPSKWIAANQTLLAWALGRILGAARRFLAFKVEVVETSDTTALSGADPVLVLARHGGPGDSFALVHMLLTRYHRGVRIVLKDILQIDPALDVLLNRLGCCFLSSPSGTGEDMKERLAQMAKELGPHDALLLFPEGGNWTPDRRLRALRRARKTDAARAASLMTHVLPPRPDGVFTCVDAHPGLAVVVVAHAGLDKMVRARQVWDHLPLTTPMKVRAWPTAQIPLDKEGRLAWLTLEWAVVDEWVDAFHASGNP
jgi:1-acyl-sn-glycerol-3-phosphate acyltransferase